MISFKKRINAEDGFSAEFSFNPIHTVNGIRYHISVIDRNRIPCAFTMEQKNNQWKILSAPQPAAWIFLLEEHLNTAIIELGENAS